MEEKLLLLRISELRGDWAKEGGSLVTLFASMLKYSRFGILPTAEMSEIAFSPKLSRESILICEREEGREVMLLLFALREKRRENCEMHAGISLI